jgi:acetylornithine/N-succinyldiaminopimelate aminotransferase
MNNIIAKEKEHIFQTYGRYDLVIKKAKGKYIWDEKGRKYLDFFTGISVTNFGHCHPKITGAVKAQLGKYMHVSNYYYTEPQVKLAEQVVKRTLDGKVFFTNSGAEACECAIKLARKWGSQNGGKYEIITFTNSFHGRTIATVTATAQSKFQQGFEPLPAGFKYAAFNDIDSVKLLVSRKTAAVMVEAVQGEGGVNIADFDFLRKLRALCDESGILLICDEVQCGMGRTGRFNAYEYAGITPDMVTLAKSFGGGLPLGACVAKHSVASALSFGDHGSTFGGNPVSCAASLALMELLTPAVLQKVTVLGDYLLGALKKLGREYGVIKDVRGLGLMAAIALDFDGKDVVKSCQKKGLLINSTQGNVLRFLPPYIIDKKDIDTAVKIVEEALKCQM